MRGRAVAHGAVTIVNAIASYKGAALGINLTTTAEVEFVERSRRIDVELVGYSEEDKGLAVKAVEAVLKRFRIRGFGAKVRTWSDIPVAKGLKSSSVASNAIILATLSALGKELGDLEAVNLGVDASIEAGVTITGAFDDASASYFGGLVVTDNFRREVLRREDLPGDLVVLLYIPPEKVYTMTVNKERLRSLGPLVDQVHALALRGEPWKAMTLNGLVYASALGHPTEIIVDAIEAGALASSLSGTGPAYAAIMEEEKLDRVEEAWSHLGDDLRVVDVNNSKARTVE